MIKHLRMVSALIGFSVLTACSSGGGGSNKAPDITMSVDKSAITVTASQDQSYGPNETIMVTVSSMPEAGLYAHYQYSSAGISNVSFFGQNTGAQLAIAFKQPQTLALGQHNDLISLSICYDDACTKPVVGSPVVINTVYVVTSGTGPTPDPDPIPDPDANLTAAPFVNSAALAHDVVDAEYSASLHAVIMVASYPANRLYRYDVQSGTETFIALPKAPTAVSVGPDGHYAAVGHDALISYIKLDDLTSGAALKPLNVTTDVLDIVLAGNGYVYAFPRRDQWEQIRSVNIATNTESGSGYTSIYAGTVGRLHPSGAFLYTADNGLSPSDIAKFDIRDGGAKSMYDSPYHGDFAMCGNLWFNTTGNRIYTACGNTFRSSDVQANDMVYSGKLALSDSQSYGFRIVALSDNEPTKSVALIESPWYECTVASDPANCRSYLRIHENEYLNVQSKYKFAKINLAGSNYSQQGKFVFHSAVDNRVIVITRLSAMPNPNSEYYINMM